MNIEVSFIIPFHKNTPLLRDVVKSVSDQKGNWSQEIILVDDSRSSKKVLFEGCTVIRSGGVGPAAARNFGAKVASGHYLAFVDSDVILEKNWLEECMCELRKFPGIASVQAPLSIGSLSPESPPLLDRYRDALKKEITNGTNLYLNGGSIMLNTAGLLCRRQAFFKVGGFETKLRRNEDLYFTYRLLMEGFALSTTLATGGKVYHDKGMLPYILKYLFQAQADRSLDKTFGRKATLKLTMLKSANPWFKCIRGICCLFYMFGLLLPAITLPPLKPLQKKNNLLLGLTPEARVVFNGFDLCLINIKTLKMAVFPGAEFSWTFPLIDQSQLTDMLIETGIFHSGGEL